MTIKGIVWLQSIFILNFCTTKVYIIGYDIKTQKLKSIKLYKIKELYILAKKQRLDDLVYATFRKIAENFEFAHSDIFDIISEKL